MFHQKTIQKSFVKDFKNCREDIIKYHVMKGAVQGVEKKLTKHW